MDLLKKIVDCIEDRLPSQKYFTGEAYDQLIDDVLEEIFGDKVEEAVMNAKCRLKWNDEFKRYE